MVLLVLFFVYTSQVFLCSFVLALLFSESEVMNNNLVLCAAGLSIVALSLIIKRKQSRQRQRRSVWVRPWIERRRTRGPHAMLLRELDDEDRGAYLTYMRMDKETFLVIASKVAPIIGRQRTHLREPISVEERLSATLRFLATGESYSSLQFLTRIPENTLSYIVPETCRAIYRTLKEDYLKIPSTSDEWLKIAKEFEDRWNSVNTIGAMDGKHIRIACPRSAGSHYFNYKNFNSIVLFALAGAEYRFLYVDAGTNGQVGDSGVFAKSHLKRCLTDTSLLAIPDDAVLSKSSVRNPYVVLADDAFPLSYRVMKPYPLKNITKEERVFNYRLSRARRMVESSFGILATRFRIFLTTINLSPEKVTQITLAACTLHNMLISRRQHLYTRHEATSQETNNSAFFELRCDEELQEMVGVNPQTQLGVSRQGREVRETFKNYYNGPGRVAWQDSRL